MNTPLDCDVAVVGAGLVGCALALGLQQAGWRVRLLDRGLAVEAEDDYDLRVYAISPQSARFLDALGVWPDVLAGRASAYSHMQVWEQRPQDALHFDASDVRLQQLGHIVENRMLQHAERYSGARHALAGDAAHVVHPLAGQGVNLGFGDAQCLVEVLREALQTRRDPGSARVLARYARARQAAAGEMIAVTDGLYRAWQLQIPGWRWLRQQGMLAVNAAGPVRQALVRRACGID
jgi:2-polyprenyl-6-methoxyphenol hydroxylase-like FAD-dependent oxidoreductase